MAFSLYFYYLSSGYYFTLLLFSTITDFYIGKRIYSSTHQTEKKKWVTLSILLNLSVLGYFKYTYFFTDTFNTIFNTHIKAINFFSVLVNFGSQRTLNIYQIFLPVGISFYTFQTISYAVDIYRSKITPVKTLWDFALFKTIVIA